MGNQPGITTTDGFSIYVDYSGGFTCFTPHGHPFAWAQTLDEADRKIEQERHERLHIGRAWHARG